MNNANPESSAVRPQQGAGLEALARRYSAPLRRYFQRRVRNPDDVPDLVQDVLLRLARLGDLSSIEQPENYVFRTASSALRDKARREIAHHAADHVEFEPGTHEGSDFSPDHVLQGREALSAMYAALKALPVRTRDIFVLRVFEEQRTADVARALGISTRAVEVHYAKALAHLATVVRKHI